MGRFESEMALNKMLIKLEIFLCKRTQILKRTLEHVALGPDQYKLLDLLLLVRLFVLSVYVLSIQM